MDFGDFVLSVELLFAPGQSLKSKVIARLEISPSFSA